VVVAVMFPTFFDRVGDLLDRPVLLMGIDSPPITASKKYATTEVLRHMDEFGATIDLDHLVSGDPEYRKAIDGMHAQGKKIFAYMNPEAGWPMPAFQRLYQGLAMWRIGYDGSMTWAYANTQGDRVNQTMVWSMIYRTDDGVVDTLHWEGVREGVDDVRYLTTLYDALSRAAGRFASEPLIGSTHAWLAELDVAGGDLDTIRHEMARRIIELQNLGHQAPEQLLKNVAIQKVRITKFPEAWRFKPDPDDVGVSRHWFERGADITSWAPIRTDIDKGWDGQGFAEAQIGHGWYRTALPLDKADLAANHKYLFFEAADVIFTRASSKFRCRAILHRPSGRRACRSIGHESRRSISADSHDSIADAQCGAGISRGCDSIFGDNPPRRQLRTVEPTPRRR